MTGSLFACLCDVKIRIFPRIKVEETAFFPYNQVDS